MASSLAIGNSLASRRHASMRKDLGACTELRPQQRNVTQDEREHSRGQLGAAGQSTGRDRAVGSCGRQHCSQCLAADAVDGPA